MGLKLDGTGPGAEHDDAALMTLLAGHREFETVQAAQSSPPLSITQYSQSTESHVAIEQLDIHLPTMLTHCREGSFANAMPMPQPGRDGSCQQEKGEITERQHSRQPPIQAGPLRSARMLTQLSSQTSRAQCQTVSQVWSVNSCSAPSNRVTCPSRSTT